MKFEILIAGIRYNPNKFVLLMPSTNLRTTLLNKRQTVSEVRPNAEFLVPSEAMRVPHPMKTIIIKRRLIKP